MKISLIDYNKIPKEQYNGIYEVEDWGTFHYLNGNLHRNDGPACEYLNGDRIYYLNGKKHRLDGPAVSYFTNSNPRYNIFFKFYIDGKQYSKEEFDKVAYLYLNNLQDYL